MPPPIPSADAVKPASASTGDKSAAIHHTPLKPGMTMKDLNPEALGTFEVQEADTLKKRIGEVKIVKDVPPPDKLHLVVAKLKSGKYDVLYAGADKAAAKAAAVFNPDQHVCVEVFNSPTAQDRLRAPRSAVVHETPLKPHMTMKGYLSSLLASPLLPEGLVPSAAEVARIDALKKLSDDELKAEATKHGVSLEGLQPILDDEEREALYFDILEKEFPVTK